MKSMVEVVQYLLKPYIDSQIQTLTNNQGTMSNLTTEVISSLVGAINSIDKYKASYGYKETIGTTSKHAYSIGEGVLCTDGNLYKALQNITRNSTVITKGVSISNTPISTIGFLNDLLGANVKLMIPTATDANDFEAMSLTTVYDTSAISNLPTSMERQAILTLRLLSSPLRLVQFSFTFDGNIFTRASSDGTWNTWNSIWHVYRGNVTNASFTFASFGDTVVSNIYPLPRADKMQISLTQVKNNSSSTIGTSRFTVVKTPHGFYLECDATAGTALNNKAALVDFTIT